MFSRKTLFSVAGALALCALLVFAKGKPPGTGGGGGGGGGGDGLSGTIYLTVYQPNTIPMPDDPPYPPGNGGRDLQQMDPDGSNKTSLGLDRNVFGEPSHSLHDGQRWFLRRSQSAIFAFSDDGLTDVKLTGDTVYELTGDVRWSSDDARVSFVDAAGIYVADIVYSDGAVAGLDGPPTLAIEASGIVSHHWAPDGTEIVYAGGGQITICDLGTGDTSNLTTGAHPVWSPDGSRIAFARGWDGIYTIGPDGSGETRILRSQAGKYIWYLWPEWSPTGGHLICLASRDESLDNDVYRIAYDGSGKTNLTKDVDTDAIPIAWR